AARASSRSVGSSATPSAVRADVGVTELAGRPDRLLALAELAPVLVPWIGHRVRGRWRQRRAAVNLDADGVADVADKDELAPAGLAEANEADRLVREVLSESLVPADAIPDRDPERETRHSSSSTVRFAVARWQIQRRNSATQTAKMKSASNTKNAFIKRSSAGPGA